MDSETVVVYYQIEGRAPHRIKIHEGMDLTDLRIEIVKESKLVYAPDMLLFSATNTGGAQIPINEYYFQDESQCSFKKLISLINIGAKNPILVAIGTYRYLVIFGLDIHRFLRPAAKPPVTTSDPQEGADYPRNLQEFQAYYKRYLESRVYRDNDRDIQGLPIMQPYHRQHHQQLKPGISIGPPRDKQDSCTLGALFRDNHQNDIYILTTSHALSWTGCEVFQPSALDVSTQNFWGLNF